MKIRRIFLAILIVLASLLAIPWQPVSASAPLRILTIGDSITADGRWQAELDWLLTAAGVSHDIDTEALGGSRCSRWPALIGGILAAHQPDMVILACGTNDDPNETIYGEPMTGWAFRATVEAIHAWRPADPMRILPALIGYSDPLLAPDWLLANEPRTNDVLWSQIVRYIPPVTSPSWFVGIADLQRVPATATYLDGDDCVPATTTCGVHPTARGYQAVGRLIYDAASAGMGWPTASVPPLCDMYGHRKGYPRPAYTPCV